MYDCTGMNVLGPTTDMELAQALSYRRDIVDVYSNSWGPFFIGGPGNVTERILKNGVREVTLLIC